MGYLILDSEERKLFRSKNANYDFNKETGEMATWGKTLEEDAVAFPAPTILDLEVTTKCTGVGGVLCPFCSPAGTKVLVKVEGEVEEIPIEEVTVGDTIVTFSDNEHKGRYLDNKVAEVYERDYEGILVSIEMENGRILKLTPDHKVMTKNRGWVLAKDLEEPDELIGYDEGFYKCSCCDSFIERSIQILIRII